MDQTTYYKAGRGAVWRQDIMVAVYDGTCIADGVLLGFSRRDISELRCRRSL